MGAAAAISPPLLRSAGVYPASGAEEPLCPNRVPKKNYTPTYNGCGPGFITSIVPQTWGDARLYLGCNRHDICYGTCNSVKSACDAEFLALMKAECARAYPPGQQSTPDPQGLSFEKTYGMCVSVANKYHGAVAKIGAGPYKTAQQEACDCCKELETKCGQQGKEVCCEVCQTCQGDQCKPRCPDLCAPCDESTGECKKKDCPLCTDCRDGECVPKDCQTCEECFLDECVSTCPPDEECCHDQCVDPTCPPGETFNSSTCQCQCAGQMCNGECCPAGQICCRGQCQSNPCVSRSYCACNGQTYDDHNVCLAECHVSLGCFTGICGPV